MADITLSSAIRDNLLSLQNTQTLTDRTQGRLSTGLKVASAVDDPVAYFQSKSLNDRATDLSTYKSGIDQGVSSLSTALQGITSVQNLVNQLKGLALNSQSATSSQIGNLVTQFNTLRTQINLLTTDTQYQGLNLIAATGSQLNISFSNLTQSNLVVNSVDITVGANGLNIGQALTANGGFAVAFSGDATARNLGGSTTNDLVSVTYAGTATTLTSGNYTFSYGGVTISFTVASAGALPSQGNFTSTQSFTVGQTLNFATLYTGAYDARTAVTGNTINGNAIAVEYGAGTQNGASLSGGTVLTVDFNGLTGSTLASGTYTFLFNGVTMSFLVGSAGMTASSATFSATQSFLNGSAITFTISTSVVATDFSAGYLIMAANASGYGVSYANVTNGVYYVGNSSLAGTTIYGGQVSSTINVTGVTGQLYLDSNLAGEVNSVVTQLSNNLSVLRAQAQSLGTNVAMLNTRLDFTNNYVNLLTGGAGKLTLADLNTEGANLLALQTRQQLGIQALSFAGQNEKSVLNIFR